MRRRPPPPQGTEDAGDGQRQVFDEPVFEASPFLSMARTSFTSWSVKEMWNAAFSERSNLRIVPWHPCARANAVLQVAHDLYTIVQALVEASYVD